MDNQIIFHIDVNSAFLSWSALSELEQGSEIDLRLIPSIVGGDMSRRHGVVLAKSIPANAYGIVTGEPVAHAFRKCPNLVTVKPNHTLYEQKSTQLIRFLSNICPDLEQVSIDECDMNYTPISAKYPNIQIPVQCNIFGLHYLNTLIHSRVFLKSILTESYDLKHVALISINPLCLMHDNT